LVIELASPSCAFSARVVNFADWKKKQQASTEA
jgi:hypothetical protein